MPPSLSEPDVVDVAPFDAAAVMPDVAASAVTDAAIPAGRPTQVVVVAASVRPQVVDRHPANPWSRVWKIFHLLEAKRTRMSYIEIALHQIQTHDECP